MQLFTQGHIFMTSGYLSPHILSHIINVWRHIYFSSELHNARTCHITVSVDGLSVARHPEWRMRHIVQAGYVAGASIPPQFSTSTWTTYFEYMVCVGSAANRRLLKVFLRDTVHRMYSVDEWHLHN